MGGLGCPLSIYLASLGIGTIGIVDNDKVELSNLNRQIIYNINEFMREIDKEDAQNAMDFLNETANSTNVQSIKEVIGRIVENKMQTLMLASTNKAYVFKVLDSPIVPEIKSGPIRSIICVIGTLIGGALSLLIVFIQHYRKLD